MSDPPQPDNPFRRSLRCQPQAPSRFCHRLGLLACPGMRSPEVFRQPHPLKSRARRAVRCASNDASGGTNQDAIVSAAPSLSLASSPPASAEGAVWYRSPCWIRPPSSRARPLPGTGRGH